MSENIKHECGLAYIRLLKPISYYHRKYGSAFYGLNRLYLLMEKQHNRGQDGAGIATLKLNTEPGFQFLHRLRIAGNNAIKEIFGQVNEELIEIEKSYPDIKQYPGLLKGYLRFMGEVMMGHLRYGTQGKNEIAFCHPFLRADINPNRTLTMAGNFNLVNTEELFSRINLTNPHDTNQDSDLAAMIETVYSYIVAEDERDSEHFDLVKVLRNAMNDFDGGYVCGGLIGSGDSFVMRDPHGIRPAYYYLDEEIAVVASERPAIMTAFNLPYEAIYELPPGNALIVNANGAVSINVLNDSQTQSSCSFERIYFSRGSDADIYRERKNLGSMLSNKVLQAVNYDLKNTIVSFIPNTAETAFYGLIKGLETWLKQLITDRIVKHRHTYSDEEISELISRRVRIEKIAIKDVKMRTFITEDSSRDEMVQHVYDITYGTVKKYEDTLVVIDDSIVRGTTLRQSIIQMLSRLKPKKIIIVSSAPQIRYPDCYGIDMSKMGDFIAFQAAIALHKERKQEYIITETYRDCIQAQTSRTLHKKNFVKQIYSPFTADEISKKISVMLTPADINIPVEILFQDIEGLQASCPNHTGDWYFTGDYPTPGGNRVANQAFINYIEKRAGRGY